MSQGPCFRVYISTLMCHYLNTLLVSIRIIIIINYPLVQGETLVFAPLDK
jgi:hypothetical protein